MSTVPADLLAQLRQVVRDTRSLLTLVQRGAIQFPDDIVPLSRQIVTGVTGLRDGLERGAGQGPWIDCERIVAEGLLQSQAAEVVCLVLRCDNPSSAGPNVLSLRALERASSAFASLLVSVICGMWRKGPAAWGHGGKALLEDVVLQGKCTVKQVRAQPPNCSANDATHLRGACQPRPVVTIRVSVSQRLTTVFLNSRSYQTNTVVSAGLPVVQALMAHASRRAGPCTYQTASKSFLLLPARPCMPTCE